MCFKIDTKDLKKLTDNLRKCSKSAYPLTVRSTLNRMAFETSNTAKKDVLPKVFTLRNKYIQSTVGYKRCDNTFNIASMSSYAGQVSEWKGKSTGQLEKQEYGKPVFAKGKHTFVATPTARGGSYNKLILKSFRFSNLNVYKPHQLVKNPTLDPHKEIPQAIAFAEKYKKTFAVIAYSPVYLRYGIFGIKPTGKIGRASMLYTLEDKKTTIKRHEWLRTSMNNTLSKADEIFEDEAIKRIEKIMSQGLKSR